MADMMALIVAAGSGSRTGGALPKQYRRIAGRSVLGHALRGLDHPAIGSVRLVIGQGQEAQCREALDGRPLPPLVTGGATRRQSVLNGLRAIAEAGGAERLLIHDAARPFLPGAVIERLAKALERHDGAVPVLPVVDTLAVSEGDILGEPRSRDGLVRVQTPQAFRFAAILAAHEAWTGEEPSDDAQMARAAGLDVAMVAGDPMLEKLTYESDFAQAHRRLAAAMISRTGTGFDVHALADGEDLWLGGVKIAHDRGLKGHSDADVALHALTDALLGAAGMGDIGEHFPPSEEKWRGAPSSRFLEHACDLIRARGGRIDHVDVTLICEAPRIGPHKAKMRARIAELLGLSLQAVSVKATTTERLGFAGRGEGIAAQAAATIRLPEEP